MKKLITTILILCVSFYARAQDINTRVSNLKNKIEILKVESPGLEEQLTMNISQTSLSNFLLAVSEIHKLNINVSPELSSISLVNNFSNVSVEDMLVFLIKEYDLDIDFTGNIISVKKHVRGIKDEQEIKATYNPTTQLLNLDVKNDKLERVFRKIMDISGKNLLFSPEIDTQPLTLYIKQVPLDMALQKLAESNNLTVSTSRDGFFVFEPDYANMTETDGTAGRKNSRRRRSNFYFKVLDTINRRIAVDFQNTPIADVIYTIGAELQLDIFTASPLDQAGTATVKAENIDFDLLLNKVFESAITSTETVDNGRSNPKATTETFTYKKDGNIYYFGTESQLSLKQVELITMMHRSIQLLKNPSGSGQRNTNNFISNGGTSFFGGNNFGQNQNQNNRNNGNRNTDSNQKKPSIKDIIPADIMEGLDINIDTELNSFIVSGPGVKVERFKNFVKYIDKPVPMIIIEVMILEVSRSAVVETGVSFGLGEAPSKTIGSVFPETNIRVGADRVNKIIGNFNGFGSLNLGKVLPEFYLDIKAMEANGNIKVLSTPKLSTINGHKAYLSSGETSYYAVTTQNIFGSQNPQTSEIRNYVPIDAELSLEIMPFVSGDGEITLDVQVIQSTFNGERIADDAPPGINSREFSSIIRMQDQDVAVLGGIEEVRKDDSGSGVPGLARIPVIKWLFSKKRREDSKRKLNILIKPTVIN